MSKKIKHNTNLEIVIGYNGFGNDSIYVNLETGMDMLEIGLSEDSEGATPEEAIVDAISTLKVIIARLEKLKYSKDPMQDSSQAIANKINYFLE